MNYSEDFAITFGLWGVGEVGSLGRHESANLGGGIYAYEQLQEKGIEAANRSSRSTNSARMRWQTEWRWLPMMCSREHARLPPTCGAKQEGNPFPPAMQISASCAPLRLVSSVCCVSQPCALCAFISWCWFGRP